MTPRAVTLCELEVILISDPQARTGQEGRKRFQLSASEPDHTEVFRNYFLFFSATERRVFSQHAHFQGFCVAWQADVEAAGLDSPLFKSHS